MIEGLNLESIKKDVAAKRAAENGDVAPKKSTEKAAPPTEIKTKGGSGAEVKEVSDPKPSALSALSKKPAVSRPLPKVPGEETDAGPLVEIREEKPSGLDAAGDVISVGRRTPAKKKMQAAKAKKDAQQDDADGVTVHHLSKSAIDFVRSQFPCAGRYGDAVTAYLYVKSGRAFDVPDTIKELVKDYEEADALPDVYEKLSALDKRLQLVLAALLELEHIGVYGLFDAVGFRSKNPIKPGDLDMMENGMLELLARVREQSKKMQKELEIKNGRPIR